MVGGWAGPAAEAETEGLAGPAAEGDMEPAAMGAAVEAAPTAEDTMGEATASPGVLAGAAWAPMTATRPKRAAIILGLGERLCWDTEKEHQLGARLHRGLIYEVHWQEELLDAENGGESKETKVATARLALGLHSELNCQPGRQVALTAQSRQRNGTAASHRARAEQARGGLVA